MDKELVSKLLLQDASTSQIIKQLHKNHKVNMVECFILALSMGWILGRF
jgi:hypothetical protein